MWTAAKQGITFALGFGSSVVLARLLTPYEFGIYAMAFAIQGVLFAFAAFGIGAYILREIDLTHETLRRAFTVNALLAIALMVSMRIAAFVSDLSGAHEEIGSMLRILSWNPLLSAIEFVPIAMFTREMNYRALAIWGVVRAIVMTSGSILLVLYGFGSRGLVLAQVAGVIAGVITIVALRRREIIFMPSFRDLWPIVKFGMQLMSIGGLAQLCTRLSDLILGRSLGLATLGIYGRASTIYQMIHENVYGIVTGVLFSKLSSNLRKGDNINDLYLHALSIITGLMWPMLIGVAIISEPVVRLLFGERWLAAAAPLSILMIAQFVVIGFSMNLELFVLRHETGRQTKIEFVRAIFGVAAFAIGAQFSLVAAASARLAEVILGYLLYRPHVERLAGVTARDLSRVYREGAILTFAAVLPAATLMIGTGWRADVNILLVFGSVAAGGALWLVTLIKRNHPIAREIDVVRASIEDKMGWSRLGG